MKEDLTKAALVELDETFRDRFAAMAEDYRAAGDDRYAADAADFDAFLARLSNAAAGAHLPPGRVPSHTYFLLVAGRLVGRVGLRHRLNAALAVEGGHIGYDVSPSERRRGYGTELLRRALEKARERGLDRVFLTCDADNRASARIIEKCGGRLENQVAGARNGKLISQYWIELG